MIGEIGRYAIDDPIQTVEALRLIDELRDALGVGMEGDRYFEPTALPELEGAKGG